MNGKLNDTYYIDTNVLRSTTVPTISRSKSNIANAIKCFDNLTMPKNFSQESELNNIIKRLKQVDVNVKDMIKYINDRIKEAEAAKKAAQALAKSLNILDLNKNLNMTPVYLPEGMNNKNVIPFSNEYLQNLYDKTMATVYEKKYLEYGKVYEKKYLEYGKVYDLYKIIKENGADAIQSMAPAGNNNIFLYIGMKEVEKDMYGFPKLDKDGNKIKKDSGVMIARYNPESGDIEVLRKNIWEDLGKDRVGHGGEGSTYNIDAGKLIIINHKKDESSVFELDPDSKTTEYTEYKIPHYCRDLAYDKKNKQLLGFLQYDKIVTFMERNESKKRYDEKKTITLENNGEEFKNVQGMSADGKYIYLYDSNHKDKMSEEEWKVHKYNYDGKKVGEYYVYNKEKENIYNEKGFKEREVESGYTDNNNKSYICGPYSIVEVTNYKSDSFSTILVSNK